MNHNFPYKAVRLVYIWLYLPVGKKTVASKLSEVRLLPQISSFSFVLAGRNSQPPHNICGI